MVQAVPRWTDYRVPDSLPDDTEESVVGTQWHQEAISALTQMLDDDATRRGVTWGVCDQIALAGLRHANGRPYDPRPDVMVLPRPLPSGRVSSIGLAEAGVPLFIAEVASRSTVGDDVSDKREAYEAIGVPEYIVFDPDGALLSTPLLAWRLEDDVYVPWRPAEDGCWHSMALDIAIGATQPLLSVRDRDGREIDPPRRVRARLRDAEERINELEANLRRLGQRHDGAPE